MDMSLLADTDAGKCVCNAVKVLKKLDKRINRGGGGGEKNKCDGEMEELLRGYPRFWKIVEWPPDDRYGILVASSTPLTLLQAILQSWKDMATEERGDAEEEATSPSASSTSAHLPSRKRKAGDDDERKSASSSSSSSSSRSPAAAIATCGRSRNVSADRHRLDMELLHSSPTWRSLYLNLRRREAAVEKSHGDRLRSRREGLEKGRPKVGKVVQRTAVDRVRGGGGNNDAGGGGGGGNSKRALGAGARERRREAILSKSLGDRARQQRLARNSSSSSSSSAAAAGGGGGGALARIRTESKVAASWSKSSLGPGGRSAAPKASFGASVASVAVSERNGNGVSRATTTGKHPGGEIHVALGNGKRMTLPPKASFFAGGTGKGSVVGAAVGSSTQPHLKWTSTSGSVFSTSPEDKDKKNGKVVQQNGAKGIARMGNKKSARR
jgi:hypothetical protein